MSEPLIDMVRIQLDLTKLPVSKKQALQGFLNYFEESEKPEFIKGLVYLGYITIKQSDLKSIANINRGSKSDSLTIRISLTNPQLLQVIESFDKAASKRNFTYALLYSGLNSFIEYKIISEKKDIASKDAETIEKNIFLSGLSFFFEKVSTPSKINKPYEVNGGLKANKSDIVKDVVEKAPLTTKQSNNEESFQIQSERQKYSDAINNANSPDNVKEVAVNSKQENSHSTSHPDVDTDIENIPNDTPRKQKSWLSKISVDAG